MIQILNKFERPHSALERGWVAYMRSNEVSNEIEAKTPPNGAKDIASDLLHSSH